MDRHGDEQLTRQSNYGRVFVGLSHSNLDVIGLYTKVKCTSAGAVVLFSGCTRDNSVPEGEYVQPASKGETNQANGAHAHTVLNQKADSKSASTNTAASRSMPVDSLTYSSYVPLALKTLHSIAESTHQTHKLERIAIMHRLGTVPLGEESVVICVSAGHRREAWQAGESALEEVKRRVEIWKWEVFQGGSDGTTSKDEGPSVWRSNTRDDQIKSEVFI